MKAFNGSITRRGFLQTSATISGLVLLLVPAHELSGMRAQTGSHETKETMHEDWPHYGEQLLAVFV